MSDKVILNEHSIEYYEKVLYDLADLMTESAHTLAHSGDYAEASRTLNFAHKLIKFVDGNDD